MNPLVGFVILDGKKLDECHGLCILMNRLVYRKFNTPNTMFIRSCKYATRAVLYLALNTDEHKKIKVDAVAKPLDIPRHFLAKILMQLTKYEIVSSSKGKNGGFYLTDKNRSRTLLNVIEAIDGTAVMKECVLGLDNYSDSRPCPYHFAVSDCKKKFYNQLKDETIAMCSGRIDQSELELFNYQ